jgi:hypothetical protein
VQGHPQAITPCALSVKPHTTRVLVVHLAPTTRHACSTNRILRVHPPGHPDHQRLCFIHVPSAVLVDESLHVHMGQPSAIRPEATATCCASCTCWSARCCVLMGHMPCDTHQRGDSAPCCHHTPAEPSPCQQQRHISSAPAAHQQRSLQGLTCMPFLSTSVTRYCT